MHVQPYETSINVLNKEFNITSYQLSTTDKYSGPTVVVYFDRMTQSYLMEAKQVLEQCRSPLHYQVSWFKPSCQPSTTQPLTSLLSAHTEVEERERKVKIGRVYSTQHKERGNKNRASDTQHTAHHHCHSTKLSHIMPLFEKTAFLPS